jgi:hypothetical protein
MANKYNLVYGFSDTVSRIMWLKNTPTNPRGCKRKCVLLRADLTIRLRPQFLGVALARTLLAKDCKPEPFPFGVV